MTSDIQETQTVYNSNDVATLLKIQESTLRKYCLMLEEAGYEFLKNEFGYRGYLNDDVIALKRLIEIKKHPDMTLKKACNAVVAWLKDKSITDRNTTDITKNERHNDSYEELLNRFEAFTEQQDNFNKELIEQLKKQQSYIENILLERDKKLMEALRETQETRKLIAAAEENKKAWWKFWK